MGLMSIDGTLLEENEAVVSPLTWGCAYGYGIFETILIHQYRPVFLEQHLQRMLESARFLKLAAHSRETLAAWVDQLLERKVIASGKLKITLQALGGTRWEKGLETQTILTAADQIPYRALQYHQGVTIGFLHYTRNECSPLVKHKTLNYLESMLAREQAKEKGWFEGVFCNSKGFVCEGTFTNLFIIRQGKVITPGPEEGLLPGITRQMVMALARRDNLTLTEEQITPVDLVTADEVFLTSSLMGIMPVIQVGDHVIGEGIPGSLTKLLRARYGQALASEMT